MRRALLATLLLCPLAIPAVAAPNGAGWRSGWGIAQPPAATPQGADSGPIASVALEGADRRWQARVDNHLAGPVQVGLRQPPGAAPLPGLPLRSVLPGASSVVVTRLQLPDGVPRLDLLLDAVPGDPAAQAQDVAYRLPFDAAHLQVSQAPQGRFSHTDAENRDAIDFALPEGTPVLAARAGRVMQVQGNFVDHGLDPQRDRDRANFIRILHEDGSMAVYAHLQANGVLVRSGQRVEAGQRIGVSGNTGYSTAPHLHFVVQANSGMQLRSVPVRIVTPQGELHFAREAAAGGDAGQP
ncbi:M23 family metallopeptidase [Stenotrophomonas rhizophila]|uniref:M23 family metallopeptidase n=1 Tax=Stenotrophomonas rhizophila TaxID=216778 RepID=UPI000456A512|nr:M23 family metallopeptidase [Stenotrophomonas rhizophila]AHY58070.1 peptidase [Stenotrophomonas rhizophila]